MNLLKTKCIGIGILFLFTISTVSAATYYAKKGTGNWNDPNAWVTGTCGSTINNGPAPKYPTANDIAIICDGATITVLRADERCKSLTIGDGVSGFLNFGNSLNSTLSVTEDIEVNSRARIEYTGNFGRQHTLAIGRNFYNKSYCQFKKDNNDYVRILFNGPSSSKIVNSGGKWDLAYITLAKDKKEAIVEIEDPAFSKALTEGSVIVGHTSVELIKGTLTHTSWEELGNIYDPGKTLNDPMTIPADVVIEAIHGTVKIPVNNITYLRGTLRVNGGTISVSHGLMRNVSTGYGLFYQGSTSEITITDGVLFTPGVFKNSDLSSTTKFTMDGGIMVVGMIKPSTETFKINLESVFKMTSGNICIHNASTIMSDFEVKAAVRSITGGTVSFGGLFTKGPQTFYFTPHGMALPHMVVGLPTTSVTLRPNGVVIGNTINLLSLHINKGNTFDVKDTKTGSSYKFLRLFSADEYDYGFYNDGNFEAGKSWVVFLGKNQKIGGNAYTTFASLQVASSKDCGFGIQEGPILTDNILVKDTVFLFRNLDLGSHELKIGVSNSNSGFMYAEQTTGVHNGNLTRYIKAEPRPLFLEDLSDDLSTYISKITDIPFYFVIADSVEKGDIVRRARFHYSLQHADRTLRVTVRTPPQQGGYISVVYKDTFFEDGKTYDFFPIPVDFEDDGGKKIKALSVFNWTISASPQLEGGSYDIALRNRGIVIPKYQDVNLIYATIRSQTVGQRVPNVGSLPYTYYINKDSKDLDQKWYYGNFYVLRENISFTDMNNTFFMGFSDKLYGLPGEKKEGCVCGSMAPSYYYLFRERLEDPLLFPLAFSSEDIIESEKIAEFTIFPNPMSGGIIKLQIPQEYKSNIRYRLVNSYGEIILENDLANQSSGNEINVSSCQPGVYTLVVSNGDKTYQKRIFINN